MKNFTRFLALTLAVLFAVGTIGLAADTYQDTAESPYVKEIDTVTSLGIIGATGLNYQPATKIARWKFVVFAAKALTGRTDDATWTGGTNTTTFTDITAKTAPAAVSYAVSLDLIKGRSETVFDPYTTITLAEATTIMVRALGYDYDVRYSTEQPDAWKWAYLAKAMELGIVDGLAADALDPDHPVTKEEAALIIYNTLFITRKNGSTIADKVWDGLDEAVTADSTQLVITSAKPAATATSLVKALAVHNTGYIKLNKLVNGKVDDSYTLYMKSAEFKTMTGYDAADVVNKHLVGASVNVVYEGDEIVSMEVNLPTVSTGLANGQQVDGTVLNLEDGEYETEGADLYVAHTSQKGYPVYREEGAPKMSVIGGTYYGVDGEEVMDYVGNKFFLDEDDNIVAEWVHDVNSVAYKGVIVSGQYGKFASSAEITVSPVAGAQANVDGNYRYATDADLAKVAYVYEEYKPSDIGNSATIGNVKDEIGFGQYTVVLFDDDGDGETDRIFVNGEVYNTIIGRVVTANKVEVLKQDAEGIPYWDDTILTVANGNLSKNFNVDGTTIKTWSALKAADSGADYFVAMNPEAANGTVELLEWLPYEYGQVVNLAEVVNPTSGYATTATIGIKDRDTGDRNNYFVDIDPTKAAVTNPNSTTAAWKYYYGTVAVGIAADVEYLAVQAGDNNTLDKTLADRSVVVSQWVEFVHAPVKAIKTVSGGKVTATETKDMILYIAKDTAEKFTNVIYVSSDLTTPASATFTFMTGKGEIKTLDNVNLVDTVFNKFSLNWLYNLKSNLSIVNDADPDYSKGYAANTVSKNTAQPDFMITELWADDTYTTDTTYTMEQAAQEEANVTYYTEVGGLTFTDAQIDTILGGDTALYDQYYPFVEQGNNAIVAAEDLDSTKTYTYYHEEAQYSNVVAMFFIQENVNADGHRSNLLYLNFTKDNVGEFYTVGLGQSIAWENTNRAKNVTEYTLLNDVYYQRNTDNVNGVDGNKYVKDHLYTADEYARRFSTATNTNGKLTITKAFNNVDKEFTFADETANFTVAYVNIDAMNVYTVTAACQLFDKDDATKSYTFYSNLEYSITAGTLVPYSVSGQQAGSVSFADVWNQLSATDKKVFTKVDRSFDEYTYTGNADITVGTTLIANQDSGFKLDGNTLYKFTAPATLTKLGTLTAAQAQQFKKTVAGYKATKDFVSWGKDGENIAMSIDVGGNDVYLFKGTAFTVADLTAEQLDLIAASVTASAWGDILHGLTVVPTENSYKYDTKNNKFEYRYSFVPTTDTIENVKFLKSSGINYDGKAFTGLLLVDGISKGAYNDDTIFVVVEPQEITVNSAKSAYTQPQGYTFTTYTASEISKMKLAVYQYRADFTDGTNGKTATYVILFGNVIPGDTCTVTLTELTNATVTGLELNVPKKVNIGDEGKVTYQVTLKDGFPILEVTVNGTKVNVGADGKFTFNIQKDKNYNVTVNATAVPVDKGTVTVNANDKTSKVTVGSEDMMNKTKQLPVGDYVVTVTPKNGYPIISAKINGEVVEVVDGTFALTVEKDQSYTVTVTCADVLYVYLDTVFNSTLTQNTAGQGVWTWTSAMNAARDIFTTEKLSGAVYETYVWEPTAQYGTHIYDGAGYYTVKYDPDENGYGEYKLIAKVAIDDNGDTTNEKIGEIFAANADKLGLGAYYGSEGSNTILFFDLFVKDGKISYASRNSMFIDNFKFVSFTTSGYTEINQYKLDTVSKTPGDANFLPWNLGADSYADSIWSGQTTEQLSAVTGDNFIEVNTLTFKYAVGSDGKIIVFTNTVAENTILKSYK